MENVRVQEYRKRVQLSEDIFLSIVRAPYSYGGPEGFYEIALLSKDGDLITHEYFPDVQDDVIGWLELSDVQDIIAELTKEITPL